MARYRIGTQVFARKKDAVDRIKTVLQGTPPGASLDSDNLALVLDLLQMHPDADRKMGPGIRAIRVEKNGAQDWQRSFVVHRTDGSIEDFSYQKCLATSAATVQRMDALKSLRRAIKPQIDAFRQGLPERSVCAITGAALARNAGHIDHADPPFSTLAEEWLAQQGLNCETLVERHLCRNTMATGPKPFLDSALEASWTAYHAKHARLQHTTTTANLRKGNRV
jgi:hypothetical protein